MTQLTAAAGMPNLSALLTSTTCTVLAGRGNAYAAEHYMCLLCKAKRHKWVHTHKRCLLALHSKH